MPSPMVTVSSAVSSLNAPGAIVSTFSRSALAVSTLIEVAFVSPTYLTSTLPMTAKSLPVAVL